LYNFVANNFRLLRGQVETEAILYVGVHARSRCWYVGRTTTNRTRGRDVWFGPAVRWMEHFTDTYSRRSADVARRYKQWRLFAPYLLSFIAVMHGEAKPIAEAEMRAIRTLQPPTQSTPTGSGQSWRQQRTRPWPSMRARPDAKKECELNIWSKTVPNKWQAQATALWSSWEEFLVYAKKSWKM
jgi:hypothetical protein